MNISFRIELLKEGEVYVALAPELNVSSFGETIEDAKRSIKEAIEAFIEECKLEIHGVKRGLTFVNEYNSGGKDLI